MGLFDALKETWEGNKSGRDVMEWGSGLDEAHEADEAREKAKKELDLSAPFKEYDPKAPKPSMGETGLGIFGGLLDTYKAVKGNGELDEGISEGNGYKALGGFHDLVEGSSGVLGNMDNNIGELAKSFGMGFSFGDAIAPSVFGNTDNSVMDANGNYVEHTARTGNDSLDSMLDGARALSDGDYGNGAEDLLAGGLHAAEAIETVTLEPGSLVTQVSQEGAIDLAKKAWSSEQSLFNPFGGLSKGIGEEIGGAMKDD